MDITLCESSFKSGKGPAFVVQTENVQTTRARKYIYVGVKLDEFVSKEELINSCNKDDNGLYFMHLKPTNKFLS